jgi:hypothetical protein
MSAVADEQPLAVAIDDAEWADDMTLRVLKSVWDDAGDRPITLVLTAPKATPELSHALRELVAGVGRSTAGEVVRLDPFDDDEMRQLVASLATWEASEDELNRLSRRLQLESGGSPFLAVTLLRDLDKATTLKHDLTVWPPPGSTYDAPLPFTMPSLARMAVVGQVARLSSDAQLVLKAASVCGLAVDSRLVKSLVKLPDEQPEAALEELERSGFLSYLGNRYVFRGKLLPAVVRSECLTRGERARFRARAAGVLETRQDLESQLLRAELLGHEERKEDAFTVAVAAAQAALESGAGRSARRAVGVAERVSGAADESAQSQIEELKARMTG